MITQESLLAEIARTDTQMMILLESLGDEELVVPCEPGINPPVWEAGHVAFFYEYFLLRHLYGVEPIMPGHDTVWDSFEIPHRERWEPGIVPDKTKTLTYYRQVIKETMDRLSAGNGLSDAELYLGQYAVAHQDMHLESLIWCRQTLGYAAPPWSAMLTGAETRVIVPPLPDADIAGGTYYIGMPKLDDGSKSPYFSFDNERPGFELAIASFSLSRTLVSQGEFLEFVEDLGYERPEFWSAGGRYWLRKVSRSHPAYWANRDGQWTVRRFNRTEPLTPSAPVIHVSFWEAEAYCRWSGRRLPSEYEWKAAARSAEARKFPWGNTPDSLPADLDAKHLGTAPVTAFPEGATKDGCLQMMGTAWEWTTNQYLPYDGFCVDLYAYMSTLQFGTHKTTRGGSGATTGSLIRNSYRQAYHPDRFDVFTGFRTCKDAP